MSIKLQMYIYINHYVRLSVIISFLATKLKNVYTFSSEVEDRRENLVNIKWFFKAVYINFYVHMSVMSFLAS